ncbi:M20/M25/M40 family metallo-hydrolase [Microbacterium sp. TNHR37B]|uniref:M20/M25/M40 family metallo-hydrolase n=1 Tax=Microbacterium sp. TNHR37B TaxID=1775956 RepID=UPI0007B2E258|nr:M20/M25/M40 family metallo-hydrolase [Microbacterium sp. TNHR37B]KZE91300.1 Succinyl-diaminopimelate desuccinylase [Microbacterium sp. TNHR37B]
MPTGVIGRDARIQARADQIVADWQALCRIPTVAGDLAAIGEAADWLEMRLRPLMDRVDRYEIPGYGPVVVGFRSGRSDRTLLLYNHYDVQPAGDPARWTSGPFDAEIRDGAMYARGACDDKADAAGRLISLELWIDEHGGDLPYSVIYLADPCEEIGSPGLADVLAAHATDLRADACLWESYLREESGRPAIGFGCRGALEIELRLDLLAAHQHPSYASVLRSAPLEMMSAIASLQTPDQRIAVEGFADGALRPDADARRRTQDIAVPGDSIARPGVDPHPRVAEDELRTRFIYEPSMSLSGFDLDDAVRQSIPASCTARVRFSLVPGMVPRTALAAVTRHLQARVPEMQVSLIREMEPAYSPVDSAFGVAVQRAARRAFGDEPVVYDVMTGAGPGAIFLEHLGAPIISPTGTLRPEGNMHGYDEHGYVEDYLQHVQFTLDVLRELDAAGFADGDARP